MSATPVEMKIIEAHALKRDDVFEMFGNLYQIDGAYTIGSTTQVHAHLIAQIDTPRALDGKIVIVMSAKTPVSIEA